ncbi:ABC transporter G family member 21-like [Octopus vulgaris]|uniref:ABC transporter G family member 21-like n=1 Tax=Octopus vulgaris TaxID=6645 RepID=A0AA36AUX5_OCTVU|nr:ABC transporter G family member 21-like [Octopus vulgaris]
MQDTHLPVKNLVFKDIVVEIKKKTILQNVWGRITSGELMAVVGPSGSGKTTLLNVISGRQHIKQGSITVNGQKLNKALSRRMSYVLQQDILPSKLTLREVLHFTAMIKLPEKMTDFQKKKRVDQIVSQMELEKCLDTVIGSSWMRGLSGGEKKRANISCELLTNPDIIIVDEPTSGLDSSLAYKLMLNLQSLARNHNKIVLATIHQPSSQIFHMFSKLLVLSNGKIVYHGDAKNTLDVFSEHGLYCAEHYNPADFILDSVQGHSQKVMKLIEYAQEANQNSLYSDSIATENDEGPSPNGEVTLLISTQEEDTEKWPTSFWTQFRWLAWRNFKQSKTRIVSKFEIFRTISLGIAIGLLYFQTERTEDRIRDVKGLLFFLVVQWSFQPLVEAILAVPEDKDLLLKERAAGYYRLSAYYMAKMFVEAPLAIVLPMVSFLLVCLLAGLDNPGVLSLSVIIIVLHAILSQGLGLLFGVVFLDIQWGLTFSTVFILVSMLFVGFYAEKIPPWLQWLKNLSFIAYSYNILVMLEFGNDIPIKCLNLTTASSFGPCKNAVDTVPSYTVVETANIDIPLYGNIILLISLLVIIRFIGYLILRFKHRPVTAK